MIEKGRLVKLYCFMFAFQSPQHIVLQPLGKLCKVPEVHCGAAKDIALDSDSEVQWDLHFLVPPGVFVDWSELEVASVDQIAIFH